MSLRVALMLSLGNAFPTAALQRADTDTPATASVTTKNNSSPKDEVAKHSEYGNASGCAAEKTAEDKQRALAKPLSGQCKFDVFLHTTYSPYTFASAAFQATWDQAMGYFPQYRGGMQGWGKRFGATLADTESRRFIQGFALSTLVGQDPRYFPSRKSGFFQRILYAGMRVGVGRTDDGRATFNFPELLGTLFASSLQNTYYPTHDRTFGATMGRFGSDLSSDVIENLLREFTPDMKRIFKLHAPQEIKRIEQKLPIPADDKP